MIDYYNNETRLTEILRSVFDNTEPDLGPARTREEIFVSRALGLTIWPAIPPRTTMEMWLAFIAGDTAEPAQGSYTVRTCAESCVITYARRVRGASAVVPIFVPHTHYERALAKFAGIVPVDWGVLGREWEHLLQTITVSVMPRSAVKVIGGERVGIGQGGEITPFQDLRGYDHPWPGGGGKNLLDFSKLTGYHASITGTTERFTITGTSSNYNRAQLDCSEFVGKGQFFVSMRGERSESLPNDVFLAAIYTLNGSTVYGGISGTQSFGADNVSDTVDAVMEFPEGATNAKLYLYVNNRASGGTGVSVVVTDARICKTRGQSWTPYENLCPITPGLTLVRDDESTLEVYGGTLDAATGVLTATHGAITLNGAETWNHTTLSGLHTFNMTLSEAPMPTTAQIGGYVGLCDTFPVDTYDWMASGASMTDNTLRISAYQLTSSRPSILIAKNDITTAADFKTWLASNPVTVIYPLATPVTYQLTEAEVQRALNCADYLGTGVWRLSCGVTIICARIQTSVPVNHYDLAASNEGWTFKITVDSATASGGSGIISVPAGNHDVVIVATPGEDAGVCIIQPTLYYTAVDGLLEVRQDMEEPEEPVEPEPEEPVEPEPEEPAEPEPEEPAEPEPEEPVEPEPEEPVEPEPEEPVEPEPKTTKRRRSK